MKAENKSYQKQEKAFKVLFLVLNMALTFVFYNAFSSKTSAIPSKALLSEQLVAGNGHSMCILNHQQKKAVDSLVPSICCRRKIK